MDNRLPIVSLDTVCEWLRRQDVHCAEAGEALLYIDRFVTALQMIAEGEPPEEERSLGLVDVWMREVAQDALKK